MPVVELVDVGLGLNPNASMALNRLEVIEDLTVDPNIFSLHTVNCRFDELKSPGYEYTYR